MRLGLTRRLSGLLLVAALGGAAPVPAVAAEAQLSGEEQARYLAELKRLYLTKDERKALLAHSNALLDTYALTAAYQVGQAQRSDLRYQLSVVAPGELLVREESRAQQGNTLAVRNHKLSVFGLDPYIRYDCPPSGIVCTLQNPADGSPWITVLRDHQGAADLAKAISFLIRNLQKS
ncbi:hypothetical protein A9179_02490 [Pseudomonas alcaligenes]|uniref:Uncharacterized protein n=1 Tax=Aquipseudomonas alcaligenes TaxID=43263 RepID=A0ABR7RY31_AQUAC|nr:hypothetical protein [Pseudomonas alcaligenes]MBC9249138.1 hypothetical protein [Pseudomonas alcaligenes]